MFSFMVQTKDHFYKNFQGFTYRSVFKELFFVVSLFQKQLVHSIIPFPVCQELFKAFFREIKKFSLMTLNKFCPVAQGEYYNIKSPDKSQPFFIFNFGIIPASYQRNLPDLSAS